MSPEEWLEAFTQIVNQPEDSINLAAAALVIAADEYPDLDVEHYLERLDVMAEHVRRRVDPNMAAEDKIRLLSRFLFREVGFKGNRENYYDPRNSYLNDVIERRVGLPITLSVIYLEVGRRLGFPLFGVGLPGHFICKWYDREQEIYVDPFSGGEIVDEFGVMRLIGDTREARMQLRREWLAPVGPRYILTRILNNLKQIFLKEDNAAKSLRVIEKLLALDPESEENLRAAGLLSYRLGSFRHAADLIAEYLLRYPEATEAVQIRAYLPSLWAVIGKMH
jgi:regulator of sirC expression with transglutaminase-like and TPR domain